MRRLDIINAVANVQRAFKESKISSFLLPGPNDRNDPEALMESYQIFSRYYDTFGEIEKKILDVFDLTGIENPKLWAKLLTGEKPEAREKGRPFYRGVIYMNDYLGKIVDLLKQDNLEYIKHEQNITVSNLYTENKSLITVILPETEKEVSNPERLIKILESINLFYKTLASIFGKPEHDLSVVAIDSGSDKSFDFLGAAKVVSAVKELIIELWDRIVFYREKKMHERIDLITKTLPVIEKINSLEKDGKIVREQAEIFRRNIFEGAKGFIAAGAILPEFSLYSTYNPRQLMSPEPKLLAMPENSEQDSNSDSNNMTHDNEQPKDDLNKDEKALLKELLERESKRKTRKKPNS
jgi:hypothetical protein